VLAALAVLEQDQVVQQDRPVLVVQIVFLEH
jgi:hypothetical protein